mmetsp:Transcript_39911/g.120525  ORF Transcript_39911/g.120525 Transcript_39911/m.120525 type:complete len:958 (-) Transcript_39911:150-3023(-)
MLREYSPLVGSSDNEGLSAEETQLTGASARDRHKQPWKCFDMSTIKERFPAVKKNSAFIHNVWLSFSVAMSITIMALPVFSSKTFLLLFGHEDTAAGAEWCGKRRSGLQVNVGNATSPLLVPFNASAAESDGAVDWSDVSWCGFLPVSYFAWWPSAAQMTLFTVYRNTGSTAKLAWQSIAGSIVAVANIWLLSEYYPSGAEDSHYNPLVVWADLLVVMFLLLASGCDGNTKKFGLSWTMYFVMKFMSPVGIDYGTYKTGLTGVTWDGEPMAVILTALFGCLVGLLATLVPLPLTNINSVRLDSERIVDELEKLFKESINYYAGGQMTPRRFQIFAKIDALKASIAQASSNLSDTYWETFNCGSYSRIRGLYRSFNNAAMASEGEAFILKSAIQSVEFNKSHQAFSDNLAEPMRDLVGATAECLRVCTAICSDGNVLPEDRKAIRNCIEKIQRVQGVLSARYTDVCNTMGASASNAIAADSLFCYSLAQWAREMMDWADDLAKYDLTVTSRYNLLHIVWEQLVIVFSPSRMFSKESLRFAVANGTPILITYVIARFMDGGVLIQYDSTMPGTLSILISNDVGSGALENIQRLTALVFGHTLPVLAMIAMGHMPCDWWATPFIHAFVLHMFIWASFYMYCASQRWSLIGLIVAAWACFPFFHTCEERAAVGYEYHYKVIAQIIMALLIKMTIQPLFAPASSRDLAMNSLKALMDEIRKCYESFFKGQFEDKDGFRSRIRTCNDMLVSCEALSAKADPAIELVGGIRLPFKKGLYDATLRQLRLVLCDLDTIASAIGGYVDKDFLPGSSEDDPPEATQKHVEAQEMALWHLLTKQPAWGTVKADLQQTISITLQAVTAVLEHSSEEALESKDTENLKHVAALSTLEGIDDLYDQVSSCQRKGDAETKDGRRSAVGGVTTTVASLTELNRTRVTVVNHAFACTVQHAAEIASACFEHMPDL